MGFLVVAIGPDGVERVSLGDYRMHKEMAMAG